MSDEIFFDGVRYVSASEAGNFANLTRNYVARLCKEGKVRARMVGSLWYVDAQSLQDFVVEREESREKRKAELAAQRKREYRKRYISAADAGDLANLTRNYVARLCKEGKVSAKMVEGQWYVQTDALKEFILQQEYVRARRQDELVEIRKREYQALPTESEQSPFSKRKVPVLSAVFPPVGDLLQKSVGITVVILFTLGTFVFVGAQYVRIADRSHLFTESLATAAQAQLAAVAENPQGALIGAFKRFARSLNTRVDSLVYNIMFPVSFVDSNVHVRVVPLNHFVASNTPASPSTSYVVQPTIERVIQEQRIVAYAGGLTEEVLDARLDELRDELIGRTVYRSQTDATHSSIENLAQDFGNSFTTNTLAATTLTVSGATSLATTTVSGQFSVSSTATSTFANGIDISDGCFAIDGNCISGGGDSSASSTLLADSNTFTGSNIFSGNIILFDATSSSFSITDLATGAGAYLAVDPSGNVISTTTPVSSSASSTLLTDTNMWSGDNTFTDATTTNFAITSLGTAAGAFLAVNPDGTVIATSTPVSGSASTTLLADSNTWSALQAFGAGASSTQLSLTNRLYVGDTATTTILGSATSTFGAGIESTYLNITGSSATSTFANGLNLSGGCVAINGTCIGGSSGNSASSTLLTDSNTFTGANTFTGNITLTNSTTTSFAIISLTNALLTTDASGNVIASSTLSQAYGGTGQTTYDPGDILYANASGVLTRLPIGGVGEVLKVTGSLPAWGIDISSGGGSGGTWSTTTSQTAGIFINYPNNASDIVAIGSNATTTAEYWFDPNQQVAYLGGSVGIGLTSPGSALDVLGTASSTNLFVNTTATTSNLAITGITSSLLSTNSLGQVVATSSIGTNLLTGSLGTINSTAFNRGDSITITAASSTLLTDTNMWTGTQNFANITFTNATTTTFAITNLTNSLLATNADGSVIATTSLSSALIPDLFLRNYEADTAAGLITFTSGIISQASSTIGDGTQTGGLTILGGATTTGNAYFAGNVGVGTAEPLEDLHVFGDTRLSGNAYYPSNANLGSNPFGGQLASVEYVDTRDFSNVSSGILTYIDADNPGDNADEVWSDGKFVYLGNFTGGLHVYSVSSIGALTHIDSDDQGDVARGVWGDGKFIYLANDTGGLHTYSVSATGTLTHIDSDDQGNAAKSVWGDGKFIYLANDTGGLHVYSVDENGSLTHIDSDDQGNNAGDVWGDGKFIYLANSVGGILSYSVNENGILTFVDSDSPGGTPTSVWGDGKFVYVGSGSAGGLFTYSVDDSGNFTLVDSDNPGVVAGIWGDGKYLYAAVGANGLFTYSVDASGNLTNIDSDDQGGTAGGVWGDGKFIYVANITEGLQAYGVNNAYEYDKGNQRHLFATGDVAIGTSSPYARLSIWDGASGTGARAFEIVNSASTTVFAVTNTGTTTLAGVLSVTGTGATSTFSSGIESTYLNITGSSATSTFANGLNLTGGCVAVNGTCIGGSSGNSASSTLLTDANTWTGTNAFANITATGATTTNIAITTITSALPLAAADGSLQEYAGTSCTNQFVRSLNGAGVATCASVQEADLNLADITLADFTNDADFVTWASATSTLWQSTGLLSTASSTIGAGGQTTGLTISGGATTTGDLIVQGTGTSTFAGSLSITGNVNVAGTATSTFVNGLNLADGCFAIDGACIGSGGGGGSGTVNSGTTGQLPYYAADGTTLTATSSIFVATSGNIGIGTTTPQGKLSVSGGGSNTLQYLFSDASSNYAALALGRRAVDAYLAIVGTAGQFTSASTAGDLVLRAEDGDLFFDTNGGSGTPALTVVAGNGNVGIGTTTPNGARALHVHGTNGIRISNSGVANNPYGDFVLVTSGTPYLDISAGDDATNRNIVLNGGGGNVGIGTTTPGSKLSVAAGVSIGANYGVAAPTNGLTVEGSVGIGTTTVGSWGLLVDAGSDGVGLHVQSANQSAVFRLSNDNAGNFWDFEPEDDGDLTIEVDDVDAFTIASTGETTITANTTGALLNLVQTNAGSDAVLSFTDGAANVGTIRYDQGTPGFDFRPLGTQQFVIANDGGIFMQNPLEGNPAASTFSTVCWNESTKELTMDLNNTCTSSSLTLKHDVNDLTIDGLSIINQLRPVSFAYNDPKRDFVQWGFIAEYNAEVDTHLTEYDDTGEVPVDIRDRAIMAAAVKAIQELNLNLETIASTTASSTTQSESFAESFFGNLFERLRNWFADAANGITEFFAERVRTNELCVADESGEETCITKAQLDALLAGQTASASNSNSGGGGGESSEEEENEEEQQEETSESENEEDSGEEESLEEEVENTDNENTNEEEVSDEETENTEQDTEGEGGPEEQQEEAEESSQEEEASEEGTQEEEVEQESGSEPEPEATQPDSSGESNQAE